MPAILLTPVLGRWRQDSEFSTLYNTFYPCGGLNEKCPHSLGHPHSLGPQLVALFREVLRNVMGAGGGKSLTCSQVVLCFSSSHVRALYEAGSKKNTHVYLVGIQMGCDS